MTSAAPDLVFYGSPVSPFVRKVCAFAEEKGAEYTVEPVDVFNPPPEFLAISPLRLIPVLRDRSIGEQGADGTIADSSAICGYLEKKHPAPALYPEAAFDHGRALFIEEYADNTLARVGGLGIFRPVYFGAVSGKGPDMETARAAWADKLPPVLDYLESALGDGEWFAGPAMSIADITVACCLMQIELVAEAPLGQWPALERHRERMLARPSIARPYAKAERFIRKALPEPLDLT